MGILWEDRGWEDYLYWQMQELSLRRNDGLKMQAVVL